MSALMLSRIAAVVMFFLPGGLALVVGLFRSRWFHEQGRPDFWQQHISPKWHRPFYIILGVILVACGLLLWFDPRGVVPR